MKKGTNACCNCCGLPHWSRRDLLKAGLALGTMGLLPAGARAAPPQPDRLLNLYNMQTGEHVRATYWANGHYLQGGLDEINHVLRDHHTDEVTAMDVRLLDTIYDLQVNLGCRGKVVYITSAYRSPATNEALRQQGVSTATHSLHMEGKALDALIPDRPLKRVYRTALDMEVGGVGYYPNAGFVHLDVGQFRRWNGG